MLFIEDAAEVVRREDGQVKLNQATNLVSTGAVGGSFWGLLFGALFMAPWMVLAVGAAVVAISGKNLAIGLDDNLIEDVSNAVEPGNPAIFILIRDVIMEPVINGLKEFDLTILRSSLSPVEEANLRQAFGADDVD